jgi:predicted GNAT family acetyltransferase
VCSLGDATNDVSSEAVDVRDNATEERFELWVGDELAGFVAYSRAPGEISFLHTEIDPSFQAHGLGHALVATVLGSAREQGLAVLPFCPYVRKFIAKNGEFLDLVPEHERGRFGL